MDDADLAIDHARVIPYRAIIVWGVLFAAALAVTGVYDELISQRLADPTRPWAQLIEEYGEIPGYVTSVVGAAIVLATNNPRAPHGKYDRKTLGVNAVCLGWLCLRFTAVIYKGSQLLPGQLSRPVAAVIGVVIVGCVCIPSDARMRVHTDIACVAQVDAWAHRLRS
jgi:hypothetical protein